MLSFFGIFSCNIRTVCRTRSVAAHLWLSSNVHWKLTFILSAFTNIVFLLLDRATLHCKVSCVLSLKWVFYFRQFKMDKFTLHYNAQVWTYPEYLKTDMPRRFVVHRDATNCLVESGGVKCGPIITLCTVLCVVCCKRQQGHSATWAENALRLCLVGAVIIYQWHCRLCLTNSPISRRSPAVGARETGGFALL